MSRLPITGGMRRVHYLNRGLASAGWEVHQFSHTSIRRNDAPIGKTFEIQSNYTETTFFNPFIAFSNRFLRQLGAPQISATLLPRMALQRRWLKDAFFAHQVVMIEHPFLFDMIDPYLGPHHFLVLDAHNVESDLYPFEPQLSVLNNHVRRALFDLERRAVRRADLILSCSREDKEVLAARFDVEADRIHVAPNGTDLASARSFSAGERLEAKRKLNIEGIAAIFVGSRWPPNMEAAAEIVRIAPSRPEITYIIAGAAGSHIEGQVPPNVRITGFVKELEPYLAASDVALNPMLSGGGSNIKLFDYLASGLPVITTAFGARGVEDPSGMAIVAAPVDFMPDMIIQTVSATNHEIRCLSARKLAESHYGWNGIAEAASNKIRANLI
ncbi:glycosyltransferase family 4 protein [Croceicoccus sp. BE223]|uniref:glycosyltransferase family 4 protein n=1 Tax=Croceicoccus sp. BE223 TaxID=2817716 RepID=UPI00285D4310|nr:glycosyltransferase family 4 protein [Croceicoccus sp. BE223]MDR7104034.1 glycosyltransferase involved in cell wall biosynthesis [Croceicoccus sp. BE223]